MQKNVSGQKWLIYAYNRGTDIPVLGGAGNITAKLRLDGATAVATTNFNPVEIEDGYYEFTLTQAETNANIIDIFPESSVSGIQVVGIPVRERTSPSSGTTSTGDTGTWTTSLVLFLRSLIGDLDGAKYTDSRLQQILVVSAYEVYTVASFETYTINIANISITPDPMTQDATFGLLMTYKAACIILGSELKLTSNISMKDGPSSIDTKGAGANIATIQKNICQIYSDMLDDYQLGGGVSYQTGGPGQAILGPYSPGSFGLNWNMNTHRENNWE